jgi:hypothetical protein
MADAGRREHDTPRIAPLEQSRTAVAHRMSLSRRRANEAQVCDDDSRRRTISPGEPLGLVAGNHRPGRAPSSNFISSLTGTH